MSNKNDPAFIALKNKWYKKLENEGFEDIEQDEDNLNIWSSYFRLGYDKTLFDAKEDYYRLAGQFLHDYPFGNAFERMVWELHSSGLSITKITEQLNKRKKTSTYRTKVQKAVTALTKQMLARNNLNGNK